MGVGTYIKKIVWFFLVGVIIVAVFRFVPHDPAGAYNWFKAKSDKINTLVHKNVDKTGIKALPTPKSILPDLNKALQGDKASPTPSASK
jgi:hypothetical protein